MANDKIRIQVHENTTEDDWKNVGFASSDLSIPVTETNPISTTGLATSAKQLPDNHQVTVSNLPITSSAVDVNLKSGDIEIGAVEIKNSTDDTRVTVNSDGSLSTKEKTPLTGFATSANQTDGSQQAKIKETVPTDATKNNPSTVLSYDGSGNLQYIDETIGAHVYRTTLSYTSNVLSGVSAVVQTS